MPSDSSSESPSSSKLFIAGGVSGIAEAFAGIFMFSHSDEKDSKTIHSIYF